MQRPPDARPGPAMKSAREFLPENVAVLKISVRLMRGFEWLECTTCACFHTRVFSCACVHVAMRACDTTQSLRADAADARVRGTPVHSFSPASCFRRVALVLASATTNAPNKRRMRALHPSGSTSRPSMCCSTSCICFEGMLASIAASSAGDAPLPKALTLRRRSSTSAPLARVHQDRMLDRYIL